VQLDDAGQEVGALGVDLRCRPILRKLRTERGGGRRDLGDQAVTHQDRAAFEDAVRQDYGRVRDCNVLHGQTPGGFRRFLRYEYVRRSWQEQDPAYGRRSGRAPS
jgi:hypothetical protein